MNKKKIIIAGGSGFLGRVLAKNFQKSGNDIVILTRSPKTTTDGVREITWDGRTLGDWARELENARSEERRVGKECVP